MDAASSSLSILIILFLIFGVPIMKHRAKVRRIRREWYARGEGYVAGRQAALSHDAPIVPPAPSWRPLIGAAIAAAVLLVGWIGYTIGQRAQVSNLPAPAHESVTAVHAGNAAAHKPTRGKHSSEPTTSSPGTPVRKSSSPGVQQFADAACLSTGSRPATDGKCYSPSEAMPAGVKPTLHHE